MMRILLVGAGGVGTAFARIAARRAFAELIIGDYDLARAQRAAAASDRFRAVRIDARDAEAVASLLAEHSCDVLMNAADPRFVMPLYTRRAAVRGSLPGHGYVAVSSASGRSIRQDWRQTG